MLSSRLIQAIADHWEQIAARAAAQIRRQAGLLELGRLPESELRERARDHGLCQTTVELYAEEELLYAVNLFFDRLVYHVVRGYERAMREGMHAVAH